MHYLYLVSVGILRYLHGNRVAICKQICEIVEFTVIIVEAEILQEIIVIDGESFLSTVYLQLFEC